MPHVLHLYPIFHFHVRVIPPWLRPLLNVVPVFLFVYFPSFKDGFHWKFYVSELLQVSFMDFNKI